MSTSVNPTAIVPIRRGESFPIPAKAQPILRNLELAINAAVQQRQAYLDGMFLGLGVADDASVEVDMQAMTYTVTPPTSKGDSDEG